MDAPSTPPPKPAPPHAEPVAAAPPAPPSASASAERAPPAASGAGAGADDSFGNLLDLLHTQPTMEHFTLASERFAGLEGGDARARHVEHVLRYERRLVHALREAARFGVGASGSVVGESRGDKRDVVTPGTWEHAAQIIMRVRAPPTSRRRAAPRRAARHAARPARAQRARAPW